MNAESFTLFQKLQTLQVAFKLLWLSPSITLSVSVAHINTQMRHRPIINSILMLPLC